MRRHTSRPSMSGRPRSSTTRSVIPVSACTLDQANLTFAAQDDKRKRKGKERPDPTQAELMRMTLRACLIARDATYNVQDLLTNSSRMAFLAIRDCEKELDQIQEDPPAGVKLLERKQAVGGPYR